MGVTYLFTRKANFANDLGPFHTYWYSASNVIRFSKRTITNPTAIKRETFSELSRAESCLKANRCSIVRARHLEILELMHPPPPKT